MTTKTKARPEVEGIIRKPYGVELVYGEGPDEGVVAQVAEWPGCMTAGDTREEALAHIEDAMRDWVEDRLARDLEIPEPMAAYSGKVLLRMPRDIHRAAERRAKETGTSLNTWLTTAIAREIGPVGLPKTLRITPGDVLVFPVPGVAIQFRALDARGDQVPDVEWSLQRRELGTITPEGLFRPGKRAMSADVIARRGDLEARTNVHVMAIRGVTEPTAPSHR